MSDQLTATNPFEYLNELFETDEIAAVRIANNWGSSFNPDARDQPLAAWQIAVRQTVFPVCIFCRWPIVDDDRHTHCEEQIRSSDEANDDDVTDPADEADFLEEIEDDDEIDDESHAEIVLGQREGFYNS